MRNLSIILALCFVGVLSPATAQDLNYTWPTNASRYLSSTFGETRSAHFHSGLDIKTWGREGYEVYAAADAVVYRLAVSVRGYGNVIYLQHPDSTFTVYAHLQRFNETLQKVVDETRMTDFSYETDILVDTLSIRVRKGDVIGYSGSTGIGPPHLHFETRTKEDIPFNALTTNLRITDTIAPTMPALQVIPLSPDTRIYGSPFPQLLYADGTHFGTVESSGPVGFAVSASDGADRVSNRYAVYRLTLSTRGDTLFHEELNTFSFDEEELMMQDRKAARGASRRSYQVLYPQDGPTVPFYTISDSAAIIHPGDTLTRYTITAADYNGNTTSATVDLMRRSYAGSSKAVPRLTLPLRDAYWTNDWIALGDKVIDLKDPEVSGGVKIDSVTHILDHMNERFLLHRLLPGAVTSVWSADGTIKVRMPSQSTFDTLSVGISHGAMDGEPWIQVLPAEAVVRNEIEVSYYLADPYFDPSSHYYLFRLDRNRDRITPVDSRQQGRTVVGYPSSFGEFLIRTDNVSPEISKPMIYRMNYGQWYVRSRITEQGSGVDHKTAIITVNGRRGIVEYDYEEEMLIYYLPGFEPEPVNKVDITVSDKAGNRVSETFEVRLPAQR